MTCKQLGGACDLVFEAQTFEEIAIQSKNHGMEMYQQGEEAHLKAMATMQELMRTPDALQEWMNDKRKEFNSLPGDE